LRGQWQAHCPSAGTAESQMPSHTLNIKTGFRKKNDTYVGLN